MEEKSCATCKYYNPYGFGRDTCLRDYQVCLGPKWQKYFLKQPEYNLWQHKDAPNLWDVYRAEQLISLVDMAEPETRDLPQEEEARNTRLTDIKGNPIKVGDEVDAVNILKQRYNQKPPCFGVCGQYDNCFECSLFDDPDSACEEYDCNDCHWESECDKEVFRREGEKSEHPAYLYDEFAHPERYTHGKIEAWDLFELALSDEEFRGGLKFAIMKYLQRYQHKGKTDDLEKMKYFIDRLIKFESGERIVWMRGKKAKH